MLQNLFILQKEQFKEIIKSPKFMPMRWGCKLLTMTVYHLRDFSFCMIIIIIVVYLNF